MVDLPPTRTLPWTPRLRRSGVMVVPAIQRWCTAPAVIRSEALISQLIQFAPARVRAREPQVTALLLDGDRAGRGSGAASRARFDNRHLLNVDLLPPAGLLIQQGFARAEFLVTGSVAADLQPYLERLRDGGLEVIEEARRARPRR